MSFLLLFVLVNKMPQIEVKNVSYKDILHDFSLSIEQGDWLTVVGPSGSGKSTFLQLIANLRSPNSGQILFEKQDIATIPANCYRRQVSYCFQQPVLFGTTVQDNLAFPFRIRKQSFDQGRVTKALRDFNLESSFLQKKITALSGGERQRVALARNLLFKPQVLLLDEVTTGLDLANEQVVLACIKKVHQAGTTIVAVTHNQQEIKAASHLFKLGGQTNA